MNPVEMSWFTDLATRAEDLLVKIDQSAQVLTREIKEDKPAYGAGVRAADSDAGQVPDATPEALPNHASTPFAASGSLKVSHSAADLSKAVRSSKLDRDAELMALLNDSATVPDQESVKPAPAMTNENGLGLHKENSLLKQEIKSLSSEVRQATQLAKQAEKGWLIYLASSN